MNTTYDLNIRYNHWRFSNGRAVTAAYIIEPAGGIFVGCDAVRVGFAICSPNDAFVKAKGRLISSGRLVKRPVTIHVPAGLSNRDILSHIEAVIGEQDGR